MDLLTCIHPSCGRTDVTVYWIMIGGRWNPAPFCPRHGAEYRVDEINPKREETPERLALD